jgi:hypothetical protein
MIEELFHNKLSRGSGLEIGNVAYAVIYFRSGLSEEVPNETNYRLLRRNLECR